MRLRISSGARHGFTLVEVALAMAIATLVMGVAILSLKGVDRERTIRRAAARLEGAARTALRESLVRHQPRCLRLAPDGFATEAPAGRLLWKRLPRGGLLEIRRWGETRWRKPEQGEAWWFHPGQPCEPVAVRLTLPEGRYEMTFDPLTAAALEEGLAVNP